MTKNESTPDHGVDENGDQFDVRDTVESARSGFNLKARLQGRGLREKHITIYTDDATGALIGEARAVETKNVLGIVTDTLYIRKGVLGEIDALPVLADDATPAERTADTKARKALDAYKAKLVAELEKTALIFHLRAVPEIIVKDAKRKAKHSIGAKKGNVPEGSEEDFEDAFTAHLLAAAIVSVSEGDEVSGRLAYEDSKALKEYLPRSEFHRLDVALGEVQFSNTVAETVTASADF